MRNKTVLKTISCALATMMFVTSLSVSAFASPVRSGIGVSAGDSAAAADVADASVADTTENTETAAQTEDAPVSSTVGLSVRQGITTVTADQAGVYVALLTANGNLFENLCDDLAIANVEDFVNVRSEANTTSEVLGKVYTGCSATILETVEGEGGQWYHIQSGSVNGYIKTEYFITGEEAANFALDNGAVYLHSTEAGLRVHEEADLDSPSVTTMYEGQEAQVLNVTDNFVHVITANYDHEDVRGYVFAPYTELLVECDEAISIEEEQAMLEEIRRQEEEAAAAAAAAAAAQRQQQAAQRAAQQAAAQQAAAQQQATSQNNSTQTSEAAQETTAAAPAASSASGARSAIVNYACSRVGCSYVWGSAGPSSFDCSGLVMAAYAQAGVSLPHQSGSQRARGANIPVSQAQPGDILWMPGHVGIYIGNGTVVEASSPGVGVIYSAVGSRWSCAVNVLG